MPKESAKATSQGVNRAVFAASERLRSETAQLVHGTLCQTLSGAGLMLKVLSFRLKAGKPVDATQLDELGAVLEQGLDEARHFLNQLQPVSSGEEGLMTALSRLAVETSKEVPCEFICESAILPRNPEAAISFYRIAEEAVKNALQHARAAQIKITLSDPDESIALEVSDDGCGFIQPASGGLDRGCSLMRCRAESEGGTFTCESGLGHGTTITYLLPKSAAQG